MAKQSPTSRTLQRCKELGWERGVVEMTIRGKGIVFTRDFIGCIDVIAYDGQPGCLGIQATSRSNVSARLKKALAEPRLQVHLRAGNRFEVWGWNGSDLKRVPVMAAQSAAGSSPSPASACPE
jgi:hypothetical protein